jgi:hypothetical protein
MITNIPVAGVLKPGVFLNDLEILILMYEEKIILSDVEIKWRIGQRIAWEETLWKGYGGMDMETKKEISVYLTKRFGSQYSLDMLAYYHEFYLTHLNLFDSVLHFDDDILSWDYYMAFLKVDDRKKRERLEHQAIEEHWSKVKLKRMVTERK